MKNLILTILFTTSLSSFAQIHVINNQLHYTEGFDLKSDSKTKMDPHLWNKNTEGSAQIFDSTPAQNELNKNINITVEYEDIKNRKRISQITQVVKNHLNEKERIFSVSLKKKDILNASECNHLDSENKKNKYTCFSVDKDFCQELSTHMKDAKVNSNDLKNCSDAMAKLNQLISSQEILKRLQKTDSYKKTAKIAHAKNILNFNGGVLGKDGALTGSLTLAGIANMASLCEKNNLDHSSIFEKLGQQKSSSKNSSSKRD